ncbi:hypothetical protein CDAR_452311 [Caerostris darwini]|uniref:Uncharacterized protein n=1 Tax=Caerostris darwini TaxID=1538125 RepID=A0AAV4VNU7_9ARAC|nr:hypothetical protein CDAR_452311 [Caerostris darwini]
MRKREEELSALGFRERVVYTVAWFRRVKNTFMMLSWGDLLVLILECVSVRDPLIYGAGREFFLVEFRCLTEACVWPFGTWRNLSRRLGDPAFHSL